MPGFKIQLTALCLLRKQKQLLCCFCTERSRRNSAAKCEKNCWFLPGNNVPTTVETKIRD